MLVFLFFPLIMYICKMLLSFLAPSPSLHQGPSLLRNPILWLGCFRFVTLQFILDDKKYFVFLLKHRTYCRTKNSIKIRNIIPTDFTQSQGTKNHRNRICSLNDFSVSCLILFDEYSIMLHVFMAVLTLTVIFN